jgi:virginiamycin B lyase
MRVPSGVTLSSALAVAALLVTATVGQAASLGTLKQFKIPTQNSSPNYITVGSDGNLWFTDSPGFLDQQIGTVTPSGAVSVFTVCDSCFPNDIAQGPDGIVYFTHNHAALGRISNAGVPLPDVGEPFQATTNHLAVAGRSVWMTDFNADVLWRYDIDADALTSFPLTTGADPGDIAVGPGGVLWFTAGSPNQIMSFDPATGVFTGSPIPSDGQPRSVAVATDGTVWFTEIVVDRVGRLDPGTGVITEFTVGVEGVDEETAEITAAPDGTMWFTQAFAGNIARIDSTGQVTAVSKAVKGSEPQGITVAANGDPWYVDSAGGKVVVLHLR